MYSDFISSGSFVNQTNIGQHTLAWTRRRKHERYGVARGVSAGILRSTESENLMRFWRTFRSWDFFPITRVPIAALSFILNLAIIASWRDWRIVVRLIRVAAGSRRFVRIAVQFSCH
jgi:hypothetical protein